MAIEKRAAGLTGGRYMCVRGAAKYLRLTSAGLYDLTSKKGDPGHPDRMTRAR